MVTVPLSRCLSLHRLVTTPPFRRPPGRTRRPASPAPREHRARSPPCPRRAEVRGPRRPLGRPPPPSGHPTRDPRHNPAATPPRAAMRLLLAAVLAAGVAAQPSAPTGVAAVAGACVGGSPSHPHTATPARAWRPGAPRRGQVATAASRRTLARRACSSPITPLPPLTHYRRPQHRRDLDAHGRGRRHELPGHRPAAAPVPHERPAAAGDPFDVLGRV